MILLYSIYLLRQCDPLWLNNKTAPLEGFSWGGRSKRETTGLLMWSNPFLIPLPSGEQVAVVLVDTQGTFDIETIVQECATVFKSQSPCQFGAGVQSLPQHHRT
ncbi:unnamed protein product [Timema podura]|uniref:GB1/RHD3-type G domain-containing protein n=1 Tax=Timema podura TaxID=61482 RepID=A0ABN7NGV4_TIMPD|nr:unnamed protein product [Timema podura]